MICGVLEIENTVQVGDKTRLDAGKSFVTKGELPVVKVEICPDFANDPTFIDVTGVDFRDWYLDWVYSGATRVVTVKLKIHIVLDVTFSIFDKTLQINTAADDMLFSNDKDLTAIEPDILKWVSDGRSSWLNVHRSAQEKIIDWLNKSGIEDAAGKALTKVDVKDVDEVRFWSRDLTLALIFKSIQNAVGDVFSEKAKFYFGEADKSTHRAKLRLDLNHDGTISKSEGVGLTSAALIRI
jgi:hypothetical protein